MLIKSVTIASAVAISRSAIPRTFAFLLLVVIAGGCRQTEPPPNAALSAFDPSAGYRYASLDQDSGNDRLFVALTFSGGGTRAAALAYGVLRELDATPLPTGSTMLDEVDLISSVSGGSFTAMHYALFGKSGFAEFEKSFLREDVEGDLLRAEFRSSRNLLRLANGSASRIGIAAEYYDREIFIRRTYADLLARRKRPFVVVNSTELGLGGRFDFTQDQFDPLCSDLGQLKVAYAVAASSAVPGLFSPLTFRNYGGQCGFREPAWIAAALGDYFGHLSRYRDAAEVRAYTDSGKRPFLHVSDGGSADNLGVRVVLDSLAYDDADPSIHRLVADGTTKRVAVIVVNAAAGLPSDVDLRARMGTVSTVHRAASTPFANYTIDTLDLLMEKMRNVASPDVKVFPIEIAFHTLPDPAERVFFESIGTSFTLSPEQVDRLIAIGGRLLRESAGYKELLADLKNE